MKFRFQALEKLRQPDDLDSPSLLAAPRTWIAVFVVLFACGAAGVWAVLGSIPVTVTAAGMLTHAGGTTVVASPLTGTVDRVDVRPGRLVTEGQALASVTTEQRGGVTVRSPFRGRVVGVSVFPAAQLGRGAPVVTIERISSPREPVVALTFVDEQHAQALRPGQVANLSVPSAPTARYGLLRGRIRSVGEFPLTVAQVASLVGGDLAARKYTTLDSPRLVVVALQRDTSTASGYAWTTTHGPPAPMRTQVPVSATMDLAEQSPISLLFGR